MLVLVLVSIQETIEHKLYTSNKQRLIPRENAQLLGVLLQKTYHTLSLGLKSASTNFSVNMSKQAIRMRSGVTGLSRWNHSL